QAVAMAFVILAVGVPGIAMESRGSHKSGPGLYESSRQQRALSDRVASVSVSQLVGFFAQIECLPNFGIQQHLPGLRGETVHIGMLRSFVQRTVALIDNFQKRLPAVDRLLGNGLG